MGTKQPARKKHPASVRYPEELKQRAVRMVQELRHEDPADHSVISRVARQLGVGVESLRSWVKQADVDAGAREGLSTGPTCQDRVRRPLTKPSLVGRDWNT